MSGRRKTKRELMEELEALRGRLNRLEERDRRAAAGTQRVAVPSQSSLLRDELNRLRVNDHLCLIYESPAEWRTTIIPFLALGLEKGEKCIYISGVHSRGEILRLLDEEGIEGKRAEKSGKIVFLKNNTRRGYRKGFDPDRMIHMLIEEVEKALASDFDAVRMTEEMGWQEGGVSAESVLEYEAKLDRDFFAKYPCIAICQYDRWKSRPEIMKSAVLTHPLLIRKRQIYQNFYYVSPEEFLTQRREERELQDMLNSIEQEGENQKRVRFLSDVLDRSSQPFGASYPDGHLMFCNAAFCALTGYTEEELRSMKWSEELTPREWREYDARVLKEIRRTGQPRRYEKECVRKDGSRLPVELLIHQVCDSGGTVQYYYMFVTDITERKRADEMLRKSEQKYRSLVENTNDVVYTTDEKGIVTKSPKVLS